MQDTGIAHITHSFLAAHRQHCIPCETIWYPT